MPKGKKNRTVKKRKNCIYTDEAKRLIGIIKEFKKISKKKSKTMRKK